MNIQERLSSLLQAFGDIAYIPNETFVSLCAANINAQPYVELDKVISEYWSQIYDLYDEHEWVWLSSQDYANRVKKELSTLSYFN